MRVLAYILIGLLLGCGEKADQQTDGSGKSTASGDQAEGDEIGFIINDGEALTNKLTIHLKITPPANAVEMKVSDDIFFRGANWEKVAKERDYIFLTQGKKTIHLVFRDKAGKESEVFLKRIEINVFATDKPFLEIENGAEFTDSKNVTIKINPPDTAAEMMLSADVTFNSSSWEPVQASVDYELPASGLNKVYIKFRTADRVISDVQSALITFTPFPLDSGKIVINNGAATAQSPLVTVAITVPAIATEMKLFRYGEEAGAVWESTKTSRAFDLKTGGAQVLNIKFRNAEGAESPIWADNIKVELFPTGTLNFNLASTNNVPSLTLNLTGITANSYATQMLVSAKESFKGASWAAFATSYTLSLNYCNASQKVYVKFKDSYGFESEAISRTVSPNCSGIPPQSCDSIAEDVYLVTIGPFVEGSCSTCHANNGAIRFTPGNHTANRNALWNFTGSSAQKFINKMTGVIPHGGNVHAYMPDLINKWYPAEDACR